MNQHVHSTSSGGLFLPPQNQSIVFTHPNTGEQYLVTNGQAVPIQPNAPIGSLPATPAPLSSEKREMPVVGYRGWNWASKFRFGRGVRGYLASHAMGPGWRQATESAACSRVSPYFATPSHRAPDQNCGCGLYVMADLDELEDHIAIQDQMVVGAVIGWGKVIQHGREGWRAEHARIIALLDCKYSEAQLKNTREAAKEYKVPLLERDGLERYVREFGDPFAEPEVRA